MKTVILCGGKGTRLREETEFKPKPMVEIGDLPILVHIMRFYAEQGFNEFVLCLGYKGDVIKDYFLNLSKFVNDFHLDLKTNSIEYLNNGHNFDFKITFVETGEDTQSGERVKMASKYIPEEEFMVTYGDGVSDIDIRKLIQFHKKQKQKHGTVTTLSAVHPSSKYGKIYADKNNVLEKFDEKPVLADYINGGFMVMEKAALKYIKDGDMLEDGLQKMTKKHKLSQYCHSGFWHSMDTMKDVMDLNKMWESGKRPWALWETKR
ncbi:MAG: hypothetical protein A2808_01090 [Candidatus Moranbacteria bacterium RIFCSPHIGHO2_01_FULL_55_24]|nr:MAG: hypothetical protein A2808_01090 [Candidatus Moranbacteria bacterium RIFCSPHIGHO2_01_FULL_55_24]